MSTVDAFPSSRFDVQEFPDRHFGDVGAHLHRIDQRVWEYSIPKSKRESGAWVEKVRIRVPTGSKNAYQSAYSVAQFFSENASRLIKPRIRHGVEESSERRDETCFQGWVIVPSALRSGVLAVVGRVWDIFLKRFPFYRHTTAIDTSVKIDIQVVGGIRMQPIFLRELAEPASAEEENSELEPLECTMRDIDRLQQQSFQDPFTVLATKAFQTVEIFFVMESEHRGSHRFTLSNGILQIKKVISHADGVLSDEEKRENREAVSTFRQFLLREYGATFVDRLEKGYGLSLRQMMEDGSPLFPDHISKANIVMNDIEISDIERLFASLKEISNRIAGEEGNHSEGIDAWLLTLHGTDGAPLLSRREIRGLLRLLPENARTMASLKLLVDDIAGSEGIISARELSQNKFNAIVAMIMPTDDERELSFTGRAIHHTPVVGWNTMGQLNVPNRFRDFFELQHVFADCRKAARKAEIGEGSEDWEPWYELLSHVVAKKSLFRGESIGSSGQDWHAGMLIPAPDSLNGEKRYYHVGAFIDDGQGSVSYSLFPACRNLCNGSGRHFPSVKLYRSTNYNSNAINWQDSIAADLNPYGAPGSLDPKRAVEYEREFFRSRTIPIWVAYLLDFEKSRVDTSIEEAAKNFIEYLRKEDPANASTIIQEVRACLELGNIQRLHDLLYEYSVRYQERPEHKLQQDMVFVGHSLGGALAQFGTAFFTTRAKRVPLPGMNCSCFAFDAPATSNKVNNKFMNFGRQHKAILNRLGIRVADIHHILEFGDPVPQAGGSHLGTTVAIQPEDSCWYSLCAKIFKPRETAIDPSVAMMPTHGRRFELAQPGIDYTVDEMDSEELFHFDHALWLQGRSVARLGLYRVRSPVLTEILRRVVGFVFSRKINRMRQLYGNRLGYRDELGVFAINDGCAGLEPC